MVHVQEYVWKLDSSHTIESIVVLSVNVSPDMHSTPKMAQISLGLISSMIPYPENTPGLVLLWLELLVFSDC
jgi:hypothetical protein